MAVDALYTGTGHATTTATVNVNVLREDDMNAQSEAEERRASKSPHNINKDGVALRPEHGGCDRDHELDAHVASADAAEGVMSVSGNVNGLNTNTNITNTNTNVNVNSGSGRRRRQSNTNGLGMGLGSWTRAG